MQIDSMRIGNTPKKPGDTQAELYHDGMVGEINNNILVSHGAWRISGDQLYKLRGRPKNPEHILFQCRELDERKNLN